jgi:DHA1 family multidrug resistance protein-like MFS transporter
VRPPADDVQPAGPRLRELLVDHRLRALLLLSTAIWFAYGLVVPALPLYARSFGASYQLVGILVGAYALGRLVCDLPSGSLVERFGARRTTFAGSVVFGLSGILTGLAPTFDIAVASQFVAGCGSAALTTGLFSYAYQTMTTRGAGRQLGLLFGAFSLGTLVGEPVGGEIGHHFGLASVMLAWGGITLAIAPLILLLLPPLPPVAAPDGVLHRVHWLDLLRQRMFLAAATANLAVFWVTAAVYFVLVPLYVRTELQLSLVVVGVIVGVATATEMLALYPAGSAADRFGRRQLLIWSLVAEGVSSALIAVAHGRTSLAILVGVTGYFAGTVVVASATLLVGRTSEQGRTTAAYRFFGDVGYVLGPLAAGWTIGGFGFGWAFVLTAVPVVPAVLLAIRWHDRGVD